MTRDGLAACVNACRRMAAADLEPVELHFLRIGRSGLLQHRDPVLAGSAVSLFWAEMREGSSILEKQKTDGWKMIGGEGGIRTLDRLLTYTHFPGVLLKPLGHLSETLLAAATLDAGKQDSALECGRIARAMRVAHLTGTRDRFQIAARPSVRDSR